MLIIQFINDNLPVGEPLVIIVSNPTPPEIDIVFFGCN